MEKYYVVFFFPEVVPLYCNGPTWGSSRQCVILLSISVLFGERSVGWDGFCLVLLACPREKNQIVSSCQASQIKRENVWFFKIIRFFTLWLWNIYVFFWFGNKSCFWWLEHKLSNQVTTFLDPKFWENRRWILQQWKRCCSCKRSRHVRRAFHERNGETSGVFFFFFLINYILPKCLTHRITERTINYMYMEKTLLWMSINFTPENSHSCLKTIDYGAFLCFPGTFFLAFWRW